MGGGARKKASKAPEVVKARDVGAPTQGTGSGDGRNELKRDGEGGEDGIWCLLEYRYEGEGGVEV